MCTQTPEQTAVHVNKLFLTAQHLFLFLFVFAIFFSMKNAAVMYLCSFLFMHYFFSNSETHFLGIQTQIALPDITESSFSL